MDTKSSSNPESFREPSGENGEPVFKLLKKITDNVWIVTRQGDPRGEQYLATPSSPFGVQLDGTVDPAENRQESDALNRLLSKHNQAYTIRQILNHENLISIAGVIEHHLFTKSSKPDVAQDNSVQLLVWDFGDAGNLSALFRQYPSESSSYYLPESLCWHVLRSLTRAVTYLHDGKRLFYPDNIPVANFTKPWLSIDRDWFPILHRGIEPKNIWFQHPRGTETYGQCKLGDFSNAAVTCHAVDAQSRFYGATSFSHGMALATREGTGRLDDVREAFEANPEKFSEGERAYTLGDEMWSVGATIFTMMTGQAPSYCCGKCGCSHVVFCKAKGCLANKAAAEGCDCLLGGCKHLTEDACGEEFSRWPKCPPEHHCSEPDLNIHSYIARSRYTKMLRTIVKDLLVYDPQEKRNPWIRMVEFADVVEDAYREWKKDTEEGRDYIDIEDDMAARLVDVVWKDHIKKHPEDNVTASDVSTSSVSSVSDFSMD